MSKPTVAFIIGLSLGSLLGVMSEREITYGARNQIANQQADILADQENINRQEREINREYDKLKASQAHFEADSRGRIPPQIPWSAYVFPEKKGPE